MIKIFLIFIIFFTLQGFANGFIAGNNFEANKIYGDITVKCNAAAGHQSARHRCYGDYLKPTSWSAVRIDTDVQADEIEIEALHEDGKTVTKKSSFNSEKGISVKRFNLWTTTLLQRQLLDLGRNAISYKLFHSDEIKETGNFEVFVSETPVRRCRYRTYNQFDSSYCSNPESLCVRYFEEENYCY